MAEIHFTIDEALRVLRANRLLPDAVRDVRGNRDGLLLTVAGGIDIALRVASFAEGILRLEITSKNWAFKMADSLGKIDAMLDEAIRDLAFIRRENKTLVLDLNEALQGRIKGIRVKDLELRDNGVRIELA